MNRTSKKANKAKTGILGKQIAWGLASRQASGEYRVFRLADSRDNARDLKRAYVGNANIKLVRIQATLEHYTK